MNETIETIQEIDDHPLIINYNQSRHSILIYDSIFLTDIFLKRLLGDNQLQRREDVNMKKLLRAFKAFYYQRYYKISQRNRSRKRIVTKSVYNHISEHDGEYPILCFTDALVEHQIDLQRDVQQKLKVMPRTISN